MASQHINRRTDETAGLSLRDRILAVFGPAFSTALIEYSKYLSEIDTDFIVCMARKSARLVDLLSLAGLPKPNRPIVYHYTLEQDLGRFAGKSVTLVDDTLILGTTIGRAKRQLLEAGADLVSTVVFAVDDQYWDARLIVPEKHFLRLDHRQLLEFCSAEIKAFSKFRIPYLTDFPIVDDIKMSRARFAQLSWLSSWDLHSLTHHLSEADESRSFTALPEESHIPRIDGILGEAVAHTLEVTKVRIFSRRDRKGHHWVRVIPIATLRPMNASSINQLFHILVKSIERHSSNRIDSFHANLTSTLSKLRFCQYIMSAIVGNLFLAEFSQVTGLTNDFNYSRVESSRLFGPWSQSDLITCHSAIALITSSGLEAEAAKSKIRSAKVPVSISKITNEECDEFVRRGGEFETLESRLGQVFLKLHKRYELAQRDEVRARGEAIFESDFQQTPSRDRLSYGFSWDTIARSIIKAEGLTPTPHRILLLSLILDKKVDAGVAVPIFCEREGVFFRAYRYGEDVPFEDQENGLAFRVAKGFLDGSERNNIPRIEMEKLLVCLLQVGTREGYLEAIYGLHGLQTNTVRVGYHLHGAVVSSMPDGSLLADQHQSWLSRRLVSQGVLKTDGSGLYILGEEPEAAFLPGDGLTQAEQLGQIVGLLIAAKREDGSHVLSTNDLVAITTCSQPKDVTLALAAELNIVLGGLTSRLRPMLEKQNGSAESRLSQFLNDSCSKALQSALMKIEAWHDNRSLQAVNAAAGYLVSQSQKFMSNYWVSLWPHILRPTDEHQREAFAPWLEKLENELFSVALGFSVIEFALASAAEMSGARGSRSRLTRARDKAKDLLKTLKSNGMQSKLIDRMTEIVENEKPIERHREALHFGLQSIFARQSVQRALIVQIVQFAQEFGRTDRKREFQYVVWYDIIDSTGQKSGLQGDALRKYRRKVRDFKDVIRSRLFDIRFDARRNDVYMHVWSNTLSAKDDEKHIFVYGPRCRDFVSSIIEIIGNEARASGVRVRILAMNADFAGEAAFHFEGQQDVEGEGFWEHGSRIKGELKKLEEPTESQVSYLWLVDRIAKRPRAICGDSAWLESGSRVFVKTKIENFSSQVWCYGGKKN